MSGFQHPDTAIGEESDGDPNSLEGWLARDPAKQYYQPHFPPWMLFQITGYRRHAPCAQVHPTTRYLGS